MTLNMCKHILIIVCAAFVAHLLPKRSHYTFQGVAQPNSTMQWSTHYSDLQGMVFVHVMGNGTIKYANIEKRVSDHFFFHLYGNVPDIYCEADTLCKAVAHLIT